MVLIYMLSSQQKKTVFFRHEYIGDLTGWLEGDIIEHNFEAYCDGEGIDVENLNDSEKI